MFTPAVGFLNFVLTEKMKKPENRKISIPVTTGKVFS